MMSEKTRWYIETGRSRVTVDAVTYQEALDEAIERIVSDETVRRSLGELVSVSRHGFDSCEDDDIFVSSVAVMERIGFKRTDDGELVRCGTCRGVGRLDCCEKVDCLDCGGLFTKLCPDC